MRPDLNNRQRQHYSDQQLTAEIHRLESTIETWARARDLWFDCGFTNYLKHVNGEPPDPSVVSILYFEGPLYGVLSGEDADGFAWEFHKLVERLGYEYENRDGTSVAFYPTDPMLTTAFASYFHWQWVCSLIQPDFADVYYELYEHFACRPDDLHNLSWREFEILLFRIFQNQGFQAELGPGRGDDGVDVRLLQRDPIGDVLTLVQAKRYAKNRKIQLDAVAALHGIAEVEGAQKTIFVTTSSYAPVARRFAARTSGRVKLATSEDVVKWCETASAGIIADKSTLVSKDHVGRIIQEASRTLDRRVVHAFAGYNMAINRFALVIKETKHAALLMTLPNHTISDDGYGQVGTQVPALDDRALSGLAAKTVWRTKRSDSDGKISYWDGSSLFHAWDGQPCYFNYAD
jgi:hypothetical protein